MNNNIYHPKHYNYGTIECIEVIKEWVKNDDGFSGFCKGNAIKYLCREKYKGGVEDIMKAKNYLEILIKYKSITENTSKPSDE